MAMVNEFKTSLSAAKLLSEFIAEEYKISGVLIEKMTIGISESVVSIRPFGTTLETAGLDERLDELYGKLTRLCAGAVLLAKIFVGNKKLVRKYTKEGNSCEELDRDSPEGMLIRFESGSNNSKLIDTSLFLKEVWPLFTEAVTTDVLSDSFLNGDRIRLD